MEYITAQQAAEKWGITVRQVQNLCTKGAVSGVMRFNRTWAIPKDAEKPKDGRYKADEAVQNNVLQSFQSIFNNKELFVKIVKFFPYPMHIAAPDGTLLIANEAFLKFFKVSSNKKIFRKHNLLHDPGLDKWGIKEHVIRAFQGEVVQVYDIKVPVQDLVHRFSDKELIFEDIFQNITSFPIYDDDHQLSYVVTVFITSRLYHGNEAIMKGKEYIETHWQEKFSIDKVADFVYLSKYHFARIFKNFTGMTPYGYYQDVKIRKLKEKLCDKNLTISEAFANCGVDYNGYLAKIFKEKVGMTPSQYKASVVKR